MSSLTCCHQWAWAMRSLSRSTAWQCKCILSVSGLVPERISHISASAISPFSHLNEFLVADDDQNHYVPKAILFQSLQTSVRRRKAYACHKGMFSPLGNERRNISGHILVETRVDCATKWSFKIILIIVYIDISWESAHWYPNIIMMKTKYIDELTAQMK